MAAIAPTSEVLAVVAGQPFTELPADLFIPPDALEVLLDSFTGPLDLLLYLIRQQNIDILNIPIAIITQQYMQYIELMEARRLELAADYLVMAALLAEIKSRLLLPANSSQQNDLEEDPRMELVRRLQEYEQFKQAASLIDGLPRLERDVFQVKAELVDGEVSKEYPEVMLSSLIAAMVDLMKRQQTMEHHHVSREVLSVRERMATILSYLNAEKLIPFSRLWNQQEGRMGLVVTLLATLELAKQSLVIITQAALYSPIHLQAKHHE